MQGVVNNPNEAPPLSSLPRLKQLIQALLMLNSRLDILSAFYDEVNAAADRKIVSFLADVERQHVFLPMKGENLKHLETFNFSSFATNRIRTWYGRCDACMDDMKLALKDLTNGAVRSKFYSFGRCLTPTGQGTAHKVVAGQDRDGNHGLPEKQKVRLRCVPLGVPASAAREHPTGEVQPPAHQGDPQPAR